VTRVKLELGPGVAVRLPVQLLLDLEECAAKQERSVSQEIRFRLAQSFEGSEPTKDQTENIEIINDSKQIIKNGGQNHEN
jgi:hypothetical protein